MPRIFGFGFGFGFGSKKSKTQVHLAGSFLLYILTHRQAPAELSASSASAEAAAAVAHGLQVVAEGTNPIVEYISHCLGSALTANLIAVSSPIMA